MELALIRTLMDKEFYDNHKGIRCPDKIFTKDVRKIKQTLDYAMDTYEKTLTPSELEALFYANPYFVTRHISWIGKKRKSTRCKSGIENVHPGSTKGFFGNQNGKGNRETDHP